MTVIFRRKYGEVDVCLILGPGKPSTFPADQ